MKSKIPPGAPGRQFGPKSLKQIAGSLKPGGVVFFNVCKKTTRPGSEPMVINGHGFGVFLGVVPNLAEEPTKEMLDPIMAGIGWVSFDHVAEFLGEEQIEILLTKFREKYGLEEVLPGESVEAPPPPPKMLTMPERPALIGRDGKPIKREDA